MLNTDTPLQLQVRPARAADEALVRLWTQNSEEISFGSARFRQGLRDLERCRMYIVETYDSLAVAQARFELSGDAWDIRFVVDPRVRQRKLEESLLRAAILALRKEAGDCLKFSPIKEPGEMPFWRLAAAGRGTTERKALSIAICSDAGSWINNAVPDLLIEWLAHGHGVAWVHSAAALPGGDICFYLSYGRIVDAATRERYLHNLVAHASDLPKGRGWSPASWLILEGANRIPVTLFEAMDRVDAGPIYLQEWIDLDGTELIDDWRGQLAQKTVELARAFVNSYPQVLKAAHEQVGEASVYPRRRAKDSALDPQKTIAEQMNQLRIVDNEGYPAFFSHNGKEYVLKIFRR